MKKKSAKNDMLPVSFIVRIYRFTAEGPEGVVGVVETVGEVEERSFTGMKELWAILENVGIRSGKYDHQGTKR